MKIFVWFIGIIVTILICIYGFLFTSFGNSIVQPIIEEKIQEEIMLDTKLKLFALDMSKFELILEISSNNTIHIKGNYSLINQAFDIAYRIKLKKLETFESLINTKLKGSLNTDGSVRGNLALMSINGKSDFANSDTKYKIVLKDFNPISIIADIKKADLKTLLYMAEQKKYLNGKIDVKINFKNIILHKLDGNLIFQTKNGKIDTALMQKDFNITLPNTNFNMNLKAEFKNDNIIYNYILNSNLAKINSLGKVVVNPLKIYVKYGIDVKELALLKPITNSSLRGVFSTDGFVKGSRNLMLIDGKSDIAQSKTNYKIELVDFKPRSAIVSIKKAKLEKLLYMLEKPSYASSDLDIELNFTSLEPKNLAGIADIKLSNGLINLEIMKNIYDVKIPKTKFNSNTHIDLKGESIDYISHFDSNFASLSSKGKIIPESMAIDAIYGVDVKELAVLKPITGADVRGSFKLDGKVKGDKSNLVVDGKSDIADSDTIFILNLKEFEPISLKASMKNLKLAKVLYMAKQANFADGIFSLNVDMSDLRESKLKGVVISSIENGLVDSRYITKAYKFKTNMPITTFKLNTKTKIDGDIADTKLNLKSTLANFDINRARINLKDSSIDSDYIAIVPNLDKLFFISDRHLKGSMIANGKFNKAKDLDLTMHSKIAGGKINLKVHNDDLHADLYSIKTLNISKILIYPELFNSYLNGNLDYNLAKENGIFNGTLKDGKFIKNHILTLVQNYARIDLYRENFKGRVNAKINKEKILSSLYLKSNSSSITTKNTKLNTKTKKIKSKIDINANNNHLTLKLTGDIEEPKIEIDAQKLIEDEIKKEVNKKLGNFLKGLF